MLTVQDLEVCLLLLVFVAVQWMVPWVGQLLFASIGDW